MSAPVGTPAAVGAVGRARRLEALEAALPLAGLAAIAATVEVAWNRVALLALRGHDDVALWLLRTGPFWRNLAAVSGLVALGYGLFSFLVMAGFAAPLRRLQVASLGGLLLSGLGLAVVVSKDGLPPPVVLLVVGVGNALVVVLAVAAGGYYRSPYRAGVWGSALASVLVLVLLVASSLESLRLWMSDGSDLGGKIAWASMIACRVGGELAWLATPLVVGRWVWPEIRAAAPRAIALGTLGAACAVALWVALRPHTDLAVIAYSAFRVTLLPEAYVGLYAVPLGAALGVGAAALASSATLTRQVGVYALLWVAAGFAPRTPIQVLYLSLAIVSITRAVQASDPEGRRRAALEWGEPLRGSAPLAPASFDDLDLDDDDVAGGEPSEAGDGAGRGTERAPSEAGGDVPATDAPALGEASVLDGAAALDASAQDGEATADAPTAPAPTAVDGRAGSAPPPAARDAPDADPVERDPSEVPVR